MPESSAASVASRCQRPSGRVAGAVQVAGEHAQLGAVAQGHRLVAGVPTASVWQAATAYATASAFAPRNQLSRDIQRWVSPTSSRSPNALPDGEGLARRAASASSDATGDVLLVGQAGEQPRPIGGDGVRRSAGARARTAATASRWAPSDCRPFGGDQGVARRLLWQPGRLGVVGASGPGRQRVGRRAARIRRCKRDPAQRRHLLGDGESRQLVTEHQGVAERSGGRPGRAPRRAPSHCPGATWATRESSARGPARATTSRLSRAAGRAARSGPERRRGRCAGRRAAGGDDLGDVERVSSGDVVQVVGVRSARSSGRLDQAAYGGRESAGSGRSAGRRRRWRRRRSATRSGWVPADVLGAVGDQDQGAEPVHAAGQVADQVERWRRRPSARPRGPGGTGGDGSSSASDEAGEHVMPVGVLGPHVGGELRQHLPAADRAGRV